MRRIFFLVVLLSFFACPVHAEEAPVEQMASLNWKTAGLAGDLSEEGSVLRNFEQNAGPETDIFITWPAPDEPLVAVDLYFGWRRFPPARLMKGPKFDADYAAALFNNKTAQAKRLRLGAKAVEQGAVVDSGARNGAPDYYYVKVVGVTRDETFIDIKGAAIGSRDYRSDERWGLPPAPPFEACVPIHRPAGDRSAMTKWEPYGSHWAEGHEPPTPPRDIAPASVPVPEKMGHLTWKTAGGKRSDDGRGTALRVWNTKMNREGTEDLLIHVEPQKNLDLEAIDVYFAWRNFAVPRMTFGHRYYDHYYLQALFDNQTAQSKRTRIPIGELRDGWFRDAVEKNGPIEYLYIKLVGVTTDGRFADIRGYSAGSASERRDPRWSLEAAPNDPTSLPSIDRPKGDRNLKTEWERYGHDWAPGHEPPIPKRFYPAGRAPIENKLGALIWEHQGRSFSRRGKPLRVWDNTGNREGNRDVFITWRPPEDQDLVAIDIYFAWRNFALGLFKPTHSGFNPDYLNALFKNETAQSKRLRIPLPEGSKTLPLVDRPSENGPIHYYYVKLVGVTADEKFVDILDYEIGSRARRKEEELPDPPESAHLIDRPEGNRNLKTKWEKYGTEWAPGHEPPKEKRTYPQSGTIPERLAALNWRTNGGRSTDDDRGTALRNWECTGNKKGDRDVIISWKPQPYELTAIDVYFGWRMFPVPRLTKTRHFDPDYSQAIFDGEAGQAARTRIPIERVPERAIVDRIADNGPNDYYYVKLVGITTDGRMVDMVGVSVGSRTYRKDDRWDLPTAPEKAHPFDRPEGNRNWRTEWEPYGSTWKPGHEPPAPSETRSFPGAGAAIEAKLGGLNWETNGGKITDDGKGTALRNWDRGPYGDRDIYISWAADQPYELMAVELVYAWRNFAVPRLKTGERAYDPEYLKAIWENRTVQTRHVRVSTDKLNGPVLVDHGSRGRPHEWYYLKLFGITTEGQLVDIFNWSIGSKTLRNKYSEPLPEGVTPTPVERPKGHRNLKTPWEPHGHEWAPEFKPEEPAEPEKRYRAGDRIARLTQLDWSVNGANDSDEGTGKAIRNWTIGGSYGTQNCYFTWQPQEKFEENLEAIDVYLFRKRIVERDFNPASPNRERLEALFENQVEGIRRIRVPAVPSRVIVDRPSQNGELDYYYVKLVGVLADGRFIDIRNYRVASLAKRRLKAPPAEWKNPFELKR